MAHGDPLFERTLDTVLIGVPSIVVAGLGVFVAIIFAFRLSRCKSRIDDNGDPSRQKMGDTIQALGEAIGTGATAFLVKEYTYLFIVALVLFVLVTVVVVCSYLAGTLTSSACGFIGMKIATYSNTRTAIAAEEGLNAALNVSFMSGS
ncbi:hppA1, partial [Symbiodinium microadriaticum]